jgi:CDP-paratose 2-epimerase
VGRSLSGPTMVIVGGAGFIGSNLAVLFKRKYASLRVLAVDNLHRRGSELNIARLKRQGVVFQHGDIRNREDLEALPGFEVMLECSAEPSVLAGYGEAPLYCLNTNLLGALNCMETARKHGAAIIFLSTSRVYPFQALSRLLHREKETRFEWQVQQLIPGWSERGVSEDFTLQGPKSLYGATKLCAEMLVEEYLHMYGMQGIINRCGVVAGPWQFGKAEQGVFAWWMLCHYFEKPLQYIGFGGQGKQVRDLLHVEDLFDLIDRQLHGLKRFSGQVYNVGGGRQNSLSLQETTLLCQEISGKRVELTSDPTSRPADIPIYITDVDKVAADFHWWPQRPSRIILEDIYRWIVEHEAGLVHALAT